jgi:copper chaperone
MTSGNEERAMVQATYTVSGMTCEHCVRAVTGELTQITGVTEVNVSLVPGGDSVVTVTSQSTLAAEAVIAALDEAGDYRLAGA